MVISLYLLVYIWLFFWACTSYALKRPLKIINGISYAILSFMLCFRYRQGTDVGYVYEWLYDLSPDTFDFTSLYYQQHTEIGWKLICNLFNCLHLEFQVFLFIHSLIELILVARFLKLYSKNIAVSLLWMYPVLYLLYMFSMMRQGLVICIFLGVLIPWLIDKKYKRYFVLTILCAFIHTSALVFLIMPIVAKLKMKHIFVIFIGCIAVLAMFVIGPIRNAIVNFFPESLKYYALDAEIGIRWYALAERMVVFLLMVYLYYEYRKRCMSIDFILGKDHTELFMKIYVVGIAIYMAFAWNALISTRMSMMFKLLEIILIPNMIVKGGYFRHIIFIAFICLNIMTYFKNVDSFLNQLNFYSHVTVFNYPYVSIWNKDAITDARPLQRGY